MENIKNELKAKNLKEFKNKYPNIDSGDLQTFILGMESIINEPLNHQPKVIFDGEHYRLDNLTLPGFIKSFAFQDEFEASMVHGLWIQYSKENKNPNYGDFQWIIKAVFRIVNVKSNWM